MNPSIIRLMALVSIGLIQVVQAQSPTFSQSPQTIYTGMTVTFTDTSGGNPVANLWRIAGVYFGGGCACYQPSITHVFGTAGTFTVEETLIFGNGSSQTASAQVTVLQGVLASNVATTTSGLAPLTVTFDSSGSTTPFPPIVSRTWAFSDGSTASGTTATRTFTTAGNHWGRVTVTDSSGFSSTKQTDVTVHSSQATIQGLGAPTRCPGDTVSVQYTLAGTGPFSIAWSDGFTETRPTAGTFVRNVVLLQSGAQTFTFTATDGQGNGTLINGAATYVVFQSVTANLSGPTGEVCAGTPFLLTAVVGGTGLVRSVTWNDGVTQGGAFASIFTRTFTRPAGTYVFSLVAASDGNCNAQVLPSITVNVVLPAASVAADTDLAYGEVGVIDVALVGQPPFNVVWSDGVTQTASTNNLQRRVNLAAATSLAVTSVTDGAGCASTAPSTSLNFSVEQPRPLDGHVWLVDTTNMLSRIRLSDGATVTSVPVSIPGFAFTAIRGLARRPFTESYFGIAVGANSSALVSMELATGVGTVIAVYNDAIRSLTFDGADRIIAATTNNGFFLPRFLVLDPTTGAATASILHFLPANSPRVAYNPNTHRLHYLAGMSGADQKTFADVSPASFSVLDSGYSARSGELAGNPTGFTWANGDNMLATLGADLYVVFPRSRGMVRAITLAQSATAIAAASDAFVHLTSSGEDLSLETSVNGVVSTSGRKDALAGDMLTLAWSSPHGSLNLATSIIVADLFLSASGPSYTSPVATGIFPVYVGESTFLTITTAILNGSTPVSGTVVVPPGLAGFSARFQAIVPTPFAKNGVFAASEGQEVRFL